MKKRGIWRVGTSILFMGCCLFQASANAAAAVAAQEQILQDQDVPRDSGSRSIEEITITGQKSGIQLRVEIKLLEEEMFGLFNELNSTDDFDVTCLNIVPPSFFGTRIPIRGCEPAYLKKARADNVSDYVATNGAVPLKGDAELMFDTRVKSEQLNVEIRKLALEHPELAKAMLDLDAMKQSLMKREQGLREEGGLFGLFKKKDEE